MGVAPGVSFQLVESTPYRLRYLCTDTGTGAATTLVNQGGPTPDLTTDLSTDPAGALRTLMGLDVADAAGARRVLMGELNAGAPNATHIFRAHARIMPREGAAVWTVDAVQDGGSGRAALTITPAGIEDNTAYLDIWCQHTRDE